MDDLRNSLSWGPGLDFIFKTKLDQAEARKGRQAKASVLIGALAS